MEICDNFGSVFPLSKIVTLDQIRGKMLGFVLGGGASPYVASVEFMKYVKLL